MKNVVITGSTRGIGLCMAKEFLKASCNVTISGRGEEFSEVLKNEFEGFENNIIYVPCDVRKVNDIEKLWRKSADKWERVDIWINNAGQNCPYEFCYKTEASFVDNIVDINIKGMVYGSQIAAKNMLIQGSGQIWNIEGLGSNNMIQEKTILYGTSKRALTYFTKALAKELKKTSVLVGRLSPGMMLTDLITKTPDGQESPVLKDKSFRYIFNVLADRPETVAEFFVPKILANTKNDAHIVWLTKPKTIWRFMTSSFSGRKLI